MKLLKKIVDLFSKSSIEKNKLTEQMPQSPIEYKNIEQSKIELLLNEHNCEDQEELVVKLVEKERLGEEFSEDEQAFFSNPEWELLKSFAELGFTLHNEQLYGRSLAVRELINNTYQTLSDEYGNPFKELINFTLKYFEKYIEDRPLDAERLLQQCFPIMHLFIQQQILKQKTLITVDNDIDEQKAYDEFLTFCSNVFCSLYPDKTKRDEQLKHHFRILHNDLIHFIEQEKT